MFAVRTMHKVGDTWSRTSHGSRIVFSCAPVVFANQTVACSTLARLGRAERGIRTCEPSDLRLGLDAVEETIFPTALEATTARHRRDRNSLSSGRVKTADFVMAIERAMQETPLRTVQDVAHCDARWELLRVAVSEAANECLTGKQERPWERNRMCKEAAAERLNMVRERVRLQNELGGAFEGIDKELADKLAFSSSLFPRMRRRYRRARQRQAEAELQEALTRQQMSEARRLAHSLARRCRRTKKRRRYNRAARDAPTTLACKALFGKEAGEGGTSADLPGNDKEGARSRREDARDTGGADQRRTRKGWSTRKKRCQGHDNVLFLKNTVEKSRPTV